MNFYIEFEQEDDGRWIAEIPEIPGVMAYGQTSMQAGEKAKALALRVLAERIETESALPVINHIQFTVSHESVASRSSLPRARRAAAHRMVGKTRCRFA